MMPLPMDRIFRTWWPLAASWFLMGLELPALSAVVARLPNPNVNLAAWGGVVFPLSLIIESPIIMLLAASTALSKDWDSYLKLRRYMMWAGGILSVLHVLVAFTPLYDLVVVGLIDAPEEIIEPGRIGLRLMIPWAWSIAYRRFNQGVLIRFGHSEAVGVGTFIRLCADGLVLGFGLMKGDLAGIVIAGSTVSLGVMSEAIYAGWRVRPVIRDELRVAPRVKEPITMRSFASFYVPLAMTSLMTLLTLPMGSAALSRMPMALESLAVWSVVGGLVFMLRSLGVAYNEVVVALLDEPCAVNSLRRYAAYLVAGTTILWILVTGTQLSTLWFGRVMALAPPLVEIARVALWFALPIPAFNVLQSWFQGLILSSRRTRGISEAVAVSLLTTGIILTIGVFWGRTTGLFVGWTAFSIGGLAQILWLWRRSRPAWVELKLRDEAHAMP
jgi:hypothetical protein